VEDGGKWAQFDPFDGFKSTSRSNQHPIFKPAHRRRRWIFDDVLSEGISRARTFGFMRDLETLRSTIWRWAQSRHAIVLDDFPSERRRLRYEDEFVKHKILDAIGDSICSAQPDRRVSAATSRGMRSTTVLRTLLADATTWGGSSVVCGCADLLHRSASLPDHRVRVAAQGSNQRPPAPLCGNAQS